MGCSAMWRLLAVADDLFAPLRGEPLFDALGNPTIRFAEFLDRLGVEVNQLISATNDASLIDLTGKIAEIQVQLGSGDALSSDDTGFTVDSGIFTVDMAEA